MANQWFYSGDVNLEYGGMFYRQSDYDDFVECIRVTPASDGGGPDNLFIVEFGSLYFGDWQNDKHAKERMESALQCCGWTNKPNPDLHERAQAIAAYAGLDQCDTYFVRIGKPEETRAFETENETPDYILRRGTKLRNWIVKQFDCDSSLPELPVIFRKMHHGKSWQVTAFFPTMPANRYGSHMTCYSHIGQHGTASLDYFDCCAPAKRGEYGDLLRELQQIYETGANAVKLVVKSRRSQKMWDTFGDNMLKAAKS